LKDQSIPLLLGVRRALEAKHGTFPHLIALFCTVAGNTSGTRGFATSSCNEIKDLGVIPPPEFRKTVVHEAVRGFTESKTSETLSGLVAPHLPPCVRE
jgi:hypothetical protein